MTKSTNSATAANSTSTSNNGAIMSKQEIIFVNSLAKISTGDSTVDKIATKVVTIIRSKELAMTLSDGEFVGVFGKANVKVSKVAKGKTSRYVLDINGLEIGGAFAAKAFNFSSTQDKVKSSTGVTFDQDVVADIAKAFEI